MKQGNDEDNKRQQKTAMMTINDVCNTCNYIITHRLLLLLISLMLCMNCFPMVFFVIQIIAISSNTKTKIIPKVVILAKLHTAFNTFISGIVGSISFFYLLFMSVCHLYYTQDNVPTKHTFLSLY